MPANQLKQHRIGRVILGVVAGFMFGLGLALMLIMYSKIALGTKAPWVVIATFVVIGIVLGLLPRRARKAKTVAAPPSS